LLTLMAVPNARLKVGLLTLTEPRPDSGHRQQSLHSCR